MHQAEHRFDTEFVQPREALVGPAEVEHPTAALGPFPQYGVAQDLKAERGDRIEITRAVVMSGILQLVEVTFCNSVDGALNAPPELQPFLPVGHSPPPVD